MIEAGMSTGRMTLLLSDEKCQSNNINVNIVKININNATHHYNFFVKTVTLFASSWWHTYKI